MKNTEYERRYQTETHYWGSEISKMALSLLETYPVTNPPPRILEIGCGEGTNAVFFAKNGYDVTAFDLSRTATEKTRELAAEAEVTVSVVKADINDFLPSENFDIVFSTGTLQYLLPEKRGAFLEVLKKFTSSGGVHVLHTFAAKSYIAPAPDAEESEYLWNSGELLSYYQDWRVQKFVEEIKECHSSGVRHEHAHNRIWARKLR